MDYKILYPNISRDYYQNGKVVLRGLCPHCNVHCTFKQGVTNSNGTVSLVCNGCQKYVVYLPAENKILPKDKPAGLKNLPEEINKYYQEALACLAAESPNGTATLFRKLIHSVAIYYKVAKVKDGNSLMGMVKKLQEKGHINPKLVEALKAVKDLGNDGAHINENEPTMEQINIAKELMDGFLHEAVLKKINTEKLKKSKNTENKKIGDTKKEFDLFLKGCE